MTKIHFALRMEYTQMRRAFLSVSICAVLMIGILSADVRAESLSQKQMMTLLQIKLEKGFTAKQIAGFGKSFKALDKNADNRLTIEEYLKNPFFKKNPAGAHRFFGGADINKDKFMTANEYAWQRIITDEARKILSPMDTNRDRRISRAEFLQNKIIGDKAISSQIFKGLDANGDGILFLPEYMGVWQKWARSDRKLKVVLK